MDRLDNSATARQDRFMDNPQQPIKTGAFGGLNTVTPILNVPYEDSPVLLNTTSGISGTMSKRLGTKQVYKSGAGVVGGFSSGTVRTASGYMYVAAKQGTSINIYQSSGGTTTQVMSKANVWNSKAQNVKAVTAVSNEVRPRVFFTTGTNTPVTLTFAESSQNPSAPGTSVTVNDTPGYFEWGTLSNVLVYKNRVLVTPGTVSWAANVLTVTGIPAFVSGDRIDVIIVTWQWCAEAFRYTGYDLYYPTAKFHIEQSDQNIAIPETVRDDIFTLNSTRVYPFYVYKSSAYNTPYTLKTDYNPTTFDEYHFGAGSIFTPGNPMNVAPNYVTFGAIRAVGSAPEEVHIIRGRSLPFNGALGATGANISVFLNGVLQAQNISAVTSAANSYYLRDTTGAILTSTGATAHHITFDSTAKIGLYFTDEIVVVNTDRTDVGAGALTALELYRDGGCSAFFGLGLFSIYRNGLHPTSVSFFQGRLVFSGWKHDTLHIAASEVWDSTLPGVNFINLNVLRNQGLAAEPIDVRISAEADDYIVHTRELHSSLFVFTRKAVFNIKPAQTAVTGVASASISKVANIGLVTPAAVESVENTILFLSDTGVYDLTPVQETGDYFTGERSIKIRNLLERKLNSTTNEIPFLTYNHLKSEVYLGFPNATDNVTASKLYIYSTFRDAWFEYTTPSGFNLWGATPITDTTEGRAFLLWATTQYSSGSPNNLVALQTDYADYYLDFVTSATGTGSSQNISLPLAKTTTLTTVNSQHEYKPSFEVTPFPEVNDLLVTLNGFKLTMGEHYSKRTNGTVYLYDNPGNGKTLVLKPRRPINDDETGELNYGTSDYSVPVVIVNNKVLQEGTGYTVSSSDGSVTLTAVAGAAIKVGVAYLSIFSTPLFTNEVLGRFKRLFHFFGYFNNEEGLDNFTGLDATGAQNPDEIVDRPKKVLGVNVAVAYDSGYSSELTYDLYSFSSLVWDFSQFDTAAPVQDKPYILFKEPILGVGYGFQVYFYNWDRTYFDLVGYQVDGKLKGRYSARGVT